MSALQVAPALTRTHSFLCLSRVAIVANINDPSLYFSLFYVPFIYPFIGRLFVYIGRIETRDWLRFSAGTTIRR